MASNTTRSQAKEAAQAANSKNDQQNPVQVATPVPTAISNLVAHYQTSIGIQSLLDLSSEEVTRPNSTGIVEVSPDSSENKPLSELAQSEVRSVLAGPVDSVQQHIKNFQQVFDLKDIQNTHAATVKLGTTKKQAKFSKTSISSLINLDETGPSLNAAIKSNTQPEKRKRASPKGELAAKKAKTDTPKKTTKATPKPDAKKEEKPEAKKDSKSDPKSTLKPEPKVEPKKAAKTKKKTPEVILPSQDKPSIHPTMTTEKTKATTPAASLPAPSFIPMDDLGLGDQGLGGAVEEKDKLPPPVIALDIPLLDPKNPKPGQAEVVVNVLKLAEEKYGWSAVHPEARSAFELMDDVLDDEEDGEEDEEEDVMIVDDNGNSSKKKEDGVDKKKKKQLQQSKVNRKVGKYDYEDPFIDDAELQWEEEITTTKEGFFVYWGPLVDERQSSKKGSAKSKK